LLVQEETLWVRLADNPDLPETAHMPDYSVTFRDPFLRAKAAADARYGRWSAWLVTGSVCIVTSLIALVVVAMFATEANAAVVISAAFLPVGFATLAAFVRERSRVAKRSRLIDELWQTYRAEVLQARTGPLRSPRPTLLQGRSRSA
jgi:hypothetical protein